MHMCNTTRCRRVLFTLHTCTILRALNRCKVHPFPPPPCPDLHPQSTLRPTLYRKTGNYIHSGNTTQICTDRVTAQPQSHAHYYNIWSECCRYSSTKSKYSSSMDFFQFSRPHNSKRLDCLYSTLEPCILSVVWTLEKPST